MTTVERAKVSSDAAYSEQWVDLGGQLMPQQRMAHLCTDLANGSIKTVDAFFDKLDKIVAAYDIDEWAWVKKAYEQVLYSAHRQ